MNTTTTTTATEFVYAARVTAHLEQDLKRGWSSWNYGEDGVSRKAIDRFLAADEALEEWERDNDTLSISMFEYTASKLRAALENDEVRELYPGYWVAVDESHGGGLACNIIDAASHDEARAAFATHRMELGEGDFINMDGATVIDSIEWTEGKTCYLLAIPVVTE